MPTAIHELFIARVEDAIHTQLKLIGDESSRAANFARKIHPARSTEIRFPVDDASRGTQTKHEPDASFCHQDARYPGVVIEVAYSQTRKTLDRLAEDYLLDSDTGIQVVIGLNIAYGKQKSRQATLSVWRTRIEDNEIKAVQVITDEVCWICSTNALFLVATNIASSRSVTRKGFPPIIQACGFN